MRGFTQEQMRYNKEEDYFTCPQGHRLNAWGTHGASGAKQYGIEKAAHCLGCRLRAACMPNAGEKSRKQITVDTSDAASRRMPFSTAMKEKIDSRQGKKIYSARMQIVEPVFANTSAHKGMNKFTLRTRKKVRIQWLLYDVVHNLSKIARALQADSVVFAV